MDVEWELVERTKSISALTLRDTSASEMEALKCDGNACFQQQQFADAIHKYSLVVGCCIEQQRVRHQENGSNEHKESLQALDAMEVAVRLNRALVYIEQHEFAHAEDDCSAVICKQEHCVKAFYRRAVAREQLGKVQEAMDDITALLKLEPMNPAALELQAVLKSQQCAKAQGIASLANEEVHARSIAKEEAVVPPPTAPSSGSSRIELAEAAERAWKLFTVATPAGHKQIESDTFKKKTNALWESLSMEEQNTVAKVYQKRRSTKASK